MSDLIAELHALAQRMAAAGETDEPVTVSLAAEEIERLRGEVEKLTRRNGLIIEEAEREGQHNRQLRIERFRQFGNEDCWIYGGDDHDNLETLVCPVVMSPQHLIEILQERDQLKAEVPPNECGSNRYGLDCSYFRGVINRELNRPLVDFKPDELARVLMRMAVTADAAVLSEPEFLRRVDLAQHDAQVIKQFVRDYTDWQGIDWMLTDFMHKRVDELNQKAKEVQS